MKLKIKLVLCVLLVAASACSANRAGSGAGENTQDYSEDMLTSDEIAELNTVQFDYDSAELSESAKQTLQQNASWLAKNNSTKVRVEGHCDERGTTEYNLALGERRARSTVDYLTALGVSQAQMEPVSFGEERPLVQGQDETAYSKNRRAAFTAEK